MLSKNISMPHPVLGVPDDMDGSFNINFKLQNNRDLQSYVFTDLQINISNPYIKELYESGVLEHILKVRCIPTYKCWIFNGFDIEIPENEIDIVIEIEAFLIAKNDFGSYNDESFSAVFGNKAFNLTKGDIVAVTGSNRIPIVKDNEKVSLGSIFKFSKIPQDDLDQELRFDLEDDQILIKYPSPNSDFDPVTLLFDRKQGLPYTALNFYIIPALTEAFSALEQEDNSLFKDKRWAVTLDLLLPEATRTDEPFTNAQRVLKTGIPINMAFDEIMKTKNIE